MKTLGKLEVNPARLLKDNELLTFRGGSCSSGYIPWYCTVWYCGGCSPFGGIACVPQGQFEPGIWVARQLGAYYAECALIYY